VGHQLNYLLKDCSGDKSLTKMIKDAGYTGVMIDYEGESGSAKQQLLDLITEFDASYPSMNWIPGWVY
jgi:hypothetical protein